MTGTRGPQEFTPVRGTSARAARVDDRSVTPSPGMAPEAAPGVAAIEPLVRRVRQRVAGTALYAGGAIVSLATAATTHEGVFLVPGVFFSMGALAGSVWAALALGRLRPTGLTLPEVLDGRWRERVARGAHGAVPEPTSAPAVAPELPRAAAAARREPSLPAVETAGGAAGRPELPDGQARVVRDAAADREAIAAVVARLGPADRAMIPDVAPTAALLATRVRELAQSLARLDAEVAPGVRDEVAVRLDAARAAAEDAPDRARRVELLERQLRSLDDLAQLRARLAARQEDAALLLRNMRLDLVRLSASGIEAALAEFGGHARDAGALSSDIDRALAVAAELRRG